MHFDIEHLINCTSLKEYEALYFDEAFNNAFCEHIGLERKLLELNQNNKLWHRRVWVKPKRNVPAAISKLLGGAQIEYTEILDYEPGNYYGEWTIESALLKDKIKSRGTISFEKEQTGISRIIDGSIKISIIGIGGTIESLLLKDIEKSYADTAEFTNNWLNMSK